MEGKPETGEKPYGMKLIFTIFTVVLMDGILKLRNEMIMWMKAANMVVRFYTPLIKAVNMASLLQAYLKFSSYTVKNW